MKCHASSCLTCTAFTCSSVPFSWFWFKTITKCRDFCGVFFVILEINWHRASLCSVAEWRAKMCIRHTNYVLLSTCLPKVVVYLFTPNYLHWISNKISNKPQAFEADYMLFAWKKKTYLKNSGIMENSHLSSCIYHFIGSLVYSICSHIFNSAWIQHSFQEMRLHKSEKKSSL